MSFDFDLFVIGGGSGGVRAARIAASQHGARVALAEESRMGGTCVIRGCVPKKLMIFASEAPAAAAEAREYGWRADAGAFDWPMFRGKLHTELSRLEGIYTSGLLAAGVEVFHQRARIVDPHTVELADGTRRTAAHILVAVGGRPSRPGIPGDDLAMISDDLFDMERLPGKVLVMGGGFIATEFATILKGLGCDTTLTHRRGRVLRGFDEDARALVTHQLEHIGVSLRLDVNVTAMERDGGGIRCLFDDGSAERFDAVMLATGRHPNTEGLGLEAAGVKLGKGGEIVVDQWSQTNIPSIFAVGDVTDRVNLTPVAIREGHAFADTMFGGHPRHVDHSLVASAVYTRPFELGTIGLTEEDACASREVEIYAATFRPMRSLFAGSDLRALMKLIVCAETRKVLGCHIFAPEAGEMIQLAAVAVTMGATKEDFDLTVAVHPTLAEELVTMRMPVRRSGPEHHRSHDLDRALHPA